MTIEGLEHVNCDNRLIRSMLNGVGGNEVRQLHEIESIILHIFGMILVDLSGVLSDSKV